MHIICHIHLAFWQTQLIGLALLGLFLVTPTGPGSELG